VLISSISVIPDITKVVSLDAKIPGDLVYIVGETFEELAGSEYFQMKNAVSNAVPKVDPRKNKTLYDAFYKAIQKNLIASSISIGRGGLATALAKKAIGGQLGLSVSLQNLPGQVTRDDYALYSESQGRILVTIAKENKAAFEKAFKGNSFLQIGTVTKEQVVSVKGFKGNEIINLDLKKATESYRKTFKDY
jgi:phosphoribosylformylglycinamidine synthase